MPYETRLQRLKALRRRIDMEIAIEAARLGIPQPKPEPRPSAASSLEVKRWAVENGLIPAVVRGRVHGWVREAYERAHAE